MVQGRVVRPLRMAGHPSSMQPLQDQQEQHEQQQQQRNKSVRRQSSQRHPLDNRRRSLDQGTIDSQRYSTGKMSRLKSMFGRSPRSKLHYFMPKSHQTTTTDDEKEMFYASSDTNVDYIESQRHHHRRRRRHGEQQLSVQEYRRPFQVPSHSTLSQRADFWIITAVSSCVSLASIAQLLPSSSNVLPSSNRQFAFATTILSTLIASGLGFAFRHAPVRHRVTRSIVSSPRHAHSAPIVAGIKEAMYQNQISIEFLIVSLLSLFWAISIPIIMDGFYNIGQDPLAVFGMEIWNANLFYSSWFSVLLLGLIFIDLITSTDKYGTVPISSRVSSWKENTLSKRWMLLTLSSIIVTASSATIYRSSLCSGDMLKSTDYCREALIGTMVGGFAQLLLCCCVGILYRVRNMKYTNSSSSSYYDSKGRRRKVTSRDKRKMLSAWKRDTYSSYFGSLSLLIQSINVGLLTNPVGGGPGNSSGTLYFASWMTFLVVFELCLRQLELHTTSVGRKAKKMSETASAYKYDTDKSVETSDSEDDDLPPEEESNVMRMLRNGSAGSRSSSVPVYEEVDSYSAESPRRVAQPIALQQQKVYSTQLQQAPPPRPRYDTNTRMIPTKTNDGPIRPQIEPEEEKKTSPNSSSRDFLESIQDFSIGSRSNSRDPSVDQQRALPRYSEVDSESDDIPNDKFFEEQVSRKEEELDEPKTRNRTRTPPTRTRARTPPTRTLPQHHDVLQGSRHTKGSNLSPLNESSREGRRSSDSRSKGSSIPSGSDRSPSRSGSRQSGSWRSGSEYSSEEEQEQEHIPQPQYIVPPQAYRPSSIQSKSKSHSISGSGGKNRSGSRGSNPLPAYRPNSSRSKGKSRGGSGSRGKSKSGSRGSDRSRSRGNPVVHTDYDQSSIDSLPPTVSDKSDNGQSKRSHMSGYSEGSPVTESRSKSPSNGNNNGFPKPPFQRPETEPQHQYFSDYQNPRPVTNVFTRQGLPGDESVVSDPTLDACFHNVPAQTRNISSSHIPSNRNDPGFDKDKSSVATSPSHESQYRRSSSDELPASENSGKGSGDEQVDNIVAAALAFAEKTHSLSSYGHQQRTGSPAPPPPSPKMMKRRNSGSSNSKSKGSRSRCNSDAEVKVKVSQTSGESSIPASGAASLHSFYSGDPSTAKKSEESNESNPTQPSVQNMVTAAIAYAEVTRGRGGKAQQRKSDKSSASSRKSVGKSVKSVGSMFSDSEAYSTSNEGDASEFDC